MKFMTLREFRTQTAAVRRQLEQEEEIILTANGRPLALMTAVDPDHLEEDLLAIRRARARLALDRIHSRVEEAGTADLPMEQIDEAVAQVRQERRQPNKT